MFVACLLHPRMCCKTIFTTRMSTIDSRKSTSAQRRFKNTAQLDFATHSPRLQPYRRTAANGRGVPLAIIRNAAKQPVFDQSSARGAASRSPFISSTSWISSAIASVSFRPCGVTILRRSQNSARRGWSLQSAFIPTAEKQSKRQSSRQLAVSRSSPSQTRKFHPSRG